MRLFHKTFPKALPPTPDSDSIVMRLWRRVPSVAAAPIQESMATSTSDKGSDDDDDDHKNFCKCLALSIAYSANVGGVATLNGTPPNLIFKNNIDE